MRKYLLLILFLFIPLVFATDNAGFWVRPEFSSSQLDNICSEGGSLLYKHNNLTDWQCLGLNATNFNVTINSNTIISINESDPLAWSISESQTGLTGDKSGSFDLTTTGTGTFGDINLDSGAIVSDGLGKLSWSSSSISDGTLFGSWYITDLVGIGTAPGTYALDIDSTGTSASDGVAHFYDGVNNIKLADGYYSIQTEGGGVYVDASSSEDYGITIYSNNNYPSLYAYDNSGTTSVSLNDPGGFVGLGFGAGNFKYGSNTVSLADDTYAVNAVGDIKATGTGTFGDSNTAILGGNTYSLETTGEWYADGFGFNSGSGYFGLTSTGVSFYDGDYWLVESDGTGTGGVWWGGFLQDYGNAWIDSTDNGYGLKIGNWFEANGMSNILYLTGDLYQTGDIDLIGNITASDTITADYFIGDGSGLTDLPVPDTAVEFTDYLNRKNPFYTGKYIFNGETTNALHNAEKRFNVQTSGFKTTVTKSQLFDGNFENILQIPTDQTANVFINFSDTKGDGETNFGGVNGLVYPTGYFYLSFYYYFCPKNVNVTYTYKTNPDVHTQCTDIVDSGNCIYKCASNGVYLQTANFSILGNGSYGSYNSSLSEIEFHLTRPVSTQSTFISKYGDDYFYNELSFRNASNDEVINLNADTGTISAYNYVDWTPADTKTSKDAVDTIKNIKSKNGNIDHSSLSDFVKVKVPIIEKQCSYENVDKEIIEDCKDVVVGEKEGRSLGNQITELINANQDMIKRIEELESEIKELKK